ASIVADETRRHGAHAFVLRPLKKRHESFEVTRGQDRIGVEEDDVARLTAEKTPQGEVRAGPEAEVRSGFEIPRAVARRDRPHCRRARVVDDGDLDGAIESAERAVERILGAV